MAEVDPMRQALVTLLEELTDGVAAGEAAYILNPGDRGLLQSIDALSAEQVSQVPPYGGASVAAHVDHLRYGFEVLNRWSRGEDPFADADYSASWRRGVVSDTEWAARRAAFRRELDAWRDTLVKPRELSEVEMAGVISSVVHLAYHLGAMRQMDRSLRGPVARD